MPQTLALFICCLVVFWLFARDWTRQRRLSAALWIPLIWAAIIASKPISAWLGMGVSMETTDDYIEGSPLDRLVFITLIGMGLVILFQRRVDWGAIFRANKWLLIYFLFLGLSCLWSDYSFVAFKRWIKDLGNVVMVLVILTEADPVPAAKRVLNRCGYIIIPLSVLFIKYFPDLGRYYDKWSGQPYYCGVTTNKNSLGMTLFVCSLFLFWEALDCCRRKKMSALEKVDLVTNIGLLALAAWLLFKAQSSTAISCTMLAIALFLALKIPWVRVRATRIGSYGFAILLLVLLLNMTFNLEKLVGLVGRDMTFTGRTDIWKMVLTEDTNPFFGVGFYSFWLGDRTQRLSEKFYYHLNQAHNGYLETYLNTGWIGVILLISALTAAIGPIKKKLLSGSPSGALQFALLAAAAVYNMTEAAFDRLDLLWFAWILAVMHYPRKRKTEFVKDTTIDPGLHAVRRSHRESSPAGARVDVKFRFGYTIPCPSFFLRETAAVHGPEAFLGPEHQVS